MVLCFRMRFVVLLGSFLVVFSIGYSLLFYGKILWHTSESFVELWESGLGVKWVLLTIQSPILICFFLNVYWFQRLLQLYHSGDYWGDRAMKCYFGLIGVEVFVIVYRSVLLPSIEYVYHSFYFYETVFHMDIDLGDVLLVGITVTITYILREARHIKDENNKFV